MCEVNEPKLAATLAELGGSDQGTLVFLELRKKGVVRGKGDDKVVYGDDLVQVLLWAGFSYKALVERSYKKLHEYWGRGDFVTRLIGAAKAEGREDVTVQDATMAIQEIESAFLRVIRAPDKDGTEPPEGEFESVWEPLEVGGVRIRGAKVYKGAGNPEDHRAPVPGTVYMDGVKLGEKILVEAPNGTWSAKQKPKTVVKEIIRAWLPVGLYARYSLEIGNRLTVKVAAEASHAAKLAKVPVDPESIRLLFKVAV